MLLWPSHHYQFAVLHARSRNLYPQEKNLDADASPSDNIWRLRNVKEIEMKKRKSSFWNGNEHNLEFKAY